MGLQFLSSAAALAVGNHIASGGAAVVEAESQHAIAVVCENRAIADLIANLLSEDGYLSVSFTLDPASGLQPIVNYLLPSRSPVAIVELAYPFANGWARAELLRRLVPEAALIVLSDDPHPAMPVPTLDERIQVIAKPFDIDALTGAVARALSTSAEPVAG